MAKRKDIDAVSADGAPAQSSPKSELPTVESPSISPATAEPKIEPVIEPKLEPVAEATPAVEPIAAPTPEIAPVAETVTAPEPAAASAPESKAKLFILRPRHKRYALLAASITLAAALGAVLGAVAGGGFSTPAPRTDVAGLEQNQAIQQSIAKLNKEIGTLKASLESANKSAHSQIAKITERFERNAGAELITGSISAPQTVAPVPTPRPAPRIAAAATQNPQRPPVVQDWTIRETRDGFVYVQGHGDIYQVVPGAPLPGLGPVESIRRQDGRWVVTTPKGIIVSMRDRRYFEQF